MSHDEEEIEGEMFDGGLDDEELMEPLSDDYAFEDEEEQDRN